MTVIVLIRRNSEQSRNPHEIKQSKRRGRGKARNMHGHNVRLAAFAIIVFRVVRVLAAADLMPNLLL